MPKPKFKMSNEVADLLAAWVNGEIDQEEFDNRMDSLAAYTANVRSSVDNYYAGIQN